MAKWPLAGYDGLTQFDGVSTRYAAFGGDYQHNSVEANTQQEVFGTYTASNLRLYLSSWVGDAGVDDMIATFRVNGANGNQTITINATGEHKDTTNTDSLVSGNLINALFDHSAGGHGDEYTVVAFQATLDAGSDIPPIMGASAWAAAADFAALKTLDDRDIEADVEYTMRASRTLRNMRVYCFEYNTSDVTITMRKNRANGSLTVIVTGTGEFLDTVNTDSYVAGDEANYGSIGIVTVVQISVRSVEANTSSNVQAGSALSVGAGTEFFSTSVTGTTATEVNTQIEAEDAATIQNLFVNCFTYAETRTIRTRKNAGNGNLSVSVTGTGLFEDLSNTDTLAAGDDLALQQDAGSSGNNGYLVAVEWETAAGIDPDEIMAALRTQGEQEPVRTPAEVVSYG